jgi:TatD DNase family protein
MNTPLEVFDSHCHFDSEAFDSDRTDLWQQAITAGVKHLLIPGIHPEQWAKARATATQLDGCFYAAGLHPWWFAKWLQPLLTEKLQKEDHKQKTTDSSVFKVEFQTCLQELQEQLHAQAQDNKCLAIGETGLDILPGKKSRDATEQIDLELQIKIVNTHINAANNCQKPIILHCRKAHNALVECLKNIPVIRGGVLHGFTGSVQLAQHYIDCGLKIGVGGSITYARANKTRQAIKALPKEALVLETDAPDMPLSGKQGQRNSPEYLPLIAKALAELRGETLAEVADYTNANCAELFGF